MKSLFINYWSVDCNLSIHLDINNSRPEVTEMTAIQSILYLSVNSIMQHLLLLRKPF